MEELACWIGEGARVLSKKVDKGNPEVGQFTIAMFDKLTRAASPREGEDHVEGSKTQDIGGGCRSS